MLQIYLKQVVHIEMANCCISVQRSCLWRPRKTLMQQTSWSLKVKQWRRKSRKTARKTNTTKKAWKQEHGGVWKLRRRQRKGQRRRVRAEGQDGERHGQKPLGPPWHTLQRNPLPHFFVYITWVMLVGTMATCALFLNLYSMQWGSTTSEEWLASFFASFAGEFLLFEPLKVGMGVLRLLRESFFLVEPLKVGMGVLHLLRRKCLPVSANEGGYGCSSSPFVESVFLFEPMKVMGTG